MLCLGTSPLLRKRLRAELRKALGHAQSTRSTPPTVGTCPMADGWPIANRAIVLFSARSPRRRAGSVPPRLRSMMRKPRLASGGGPQGRGQERQGVPLDGHATCVGWPSFFSPRPSPAKESVSFQRRRGRSRFWPVIVARVIPRPGCPRSPAAEHALYQGFLLAEGRDHAGGWSMAKAIASPKDNALPRRVALFQASVPHRVRAGPKNVASSRASTASSGLS